MQVALISDLHGNAVALDAVVRELEGESFDEIVCLGDVAQGGPQPAEVVERLRDLRCPCVFGNADEFLLTLDPSGEDVDEAERQRLVDRGRWSVEQLGDERLAFLRAFQPKIELDVGGHRLVCCHATPTSNTDVVLPDTPRDRIASLIDGAAAVASGHVHLQWLRRVGRGFWLCAGSVGLVYDHKEPMDEQPFQPWGEYAVATSDGSLRLEFRRVPFDVGAHVKAIRDSGMPDAERSAREWQID
jgi:predicted phosphodiesterase